jgi:hypothetical protein
MSEQLGLEQRFRQASAVHRHERAGAPRAVRVNRLRHELFAHAAFAGNEHFGVGTRNAFDLLVQIDHRGTFTDEGVLSIASHQSFSFGKDRA